MQRSFPFSMTKWISTMRLLISLLLWSHMWTPQVRADFDYLAWQGDLEKLKQHLANSYSHFLDKVAENQVDPFSISEKAIQEIEKAKTQWEAFQVIERFLGAFGDSHLRIANKKELYLSWQGILHRYPVRFFKRGNRIFLKEIQSNDCSLREGDEIIQYNGKSILELVQSEMQNIGSGNAKTKEALAFKHLTSWRGSNQTKKMTLVGYQGREKITCQIFPIFIPTKNKKKRPEQPQEAKLNHKTNPIEACTMMGIKPKDRTQAPIDLNQLGKNFVSFDNPYFNAGVWKNREGRSEGYLRLHAFGAYGFPRLCADTWKRFRKKQEGECGESCQANFKRKVLVPKIISELNRVILRLSLLKVRTLVVDITGNGGGNNWVEVVARMLNGSKLDGLPVLYMKDKKSIDNLKNIKTELQNFISKTQEADREYPFLQKGLKTVDSQLEDAKTKCDLNELWTNARFLPNCTNLIKTSSYSTGLLPYVSQRAIKNRAMQHLLFQPANYNFRERAFSGNLIVWMDRRTASAAEQFATLMKQNQKVLLVGEQTQGSGCGYHNGGNPIELPHSKIKIKVPNCVRLDHQGRNNVFGVKPDITLAYHRDNPEETQRQLKDVLGLYLKPMRQQVFVAQRLKTLPFRVGKKPVHSLQSALKKAEKDSEIWLLDGVYRGSFQLKQKENIAIKALGDEVWVDGQQKPKKSGPSCLSLKSVKGIEVTGLKFRNCWPTAIKIKDSESIAIDHLYVEGSRRAVHATGFQTRSLSVKNSHWIQDMSGELWRSMSWDEAHHGKLDYLNGGLFTSDSILGEIHLSGNLIEDAFNGFRLVGRDGTKIKQNKDVYIYDNTFKRIRDNPIEPEVSAYNWHIYGNKILNAHAWISMTEMEGGTFYIYGNFGVQNEKYGRKGDHDKGTVFKFEKMGPYLTEPVYIFNNTWVFQHDYIRPKTFPRQLKHFNNILYSTLGKTHVISDKNFHASNHFHNDWINFSIPKFVEEKKLWPNVKQAPIPLDPNSIDEPQISLPLLKAFKPIAIELKGFEKVKPQEVHSLGAFQGDKIINALKPKVKKRLAL